VWFAVTALKRFASFVGRGWTSLSPGARGFVAGTAAGLLLSTALWHGWRQAAEVARLEQVARQNAVAALDSTRKIAAGRDTVYARILAQKDVELAGALGAAARLRGDNARLQATLRIAGAGVDTSASHSVDAGDSAGDIPGAAEGLAVADSLVLAGPPVEGTVSVTVTAQPDTTVRFDWNAKLRPTPVDLSLGLGCGEDGPELLADGPEWVGVEIAPGQVDPAVCNPPSARVGPVERGFQVVGVGAVVVGIVKALTSIF
jgi:hypothetical protein